MAQVRSRIDDVLEDRTGNYILPFFWQHGEDEARLREEMCRIHDSNIGAVCVESRPHPEFCGPSWWRDVDIIMDEARKRGMRVWVLDDAHFPTGFANGWIRDRFPERKKVFLAERHIDLSGPLKGASILVKPWVEPGEMLIAAVASRRSALGEADGTLLDLGAMIYDELLHWNIPEGYWRVFFLVQTTSGGGNMNYINPIDADSCRVLIDAVYESHYTRYASDFGKTFAGFFSDEPNIGNGGGWADALIGRKKMSLPWKRGMLAELSRELGEDAAMRLPGLWHENGPSTWPIRYAYMNLVSRLYGECFSAQIGDWCRVHGVEYIGHIIEDNDAHTRMGDSAAHFFRSMQGQDMSGIDVVLSQLRPGLDRQAVNWCGPEHADGEFFHYALGKLGASHAHLDPRKRGRAMCEIFGAYGWSEGLRLMKWMADHMLSRGINYYVPHAFSPKDFPDPDCPPHFYARGKNPQFRHFGALMAYMNRMCHLLNGGRHEAEAAILYHAEAEWSGRAMSVKKPLRILMQAQLDADVIPLDILLDGATVEDGALKVNGESFKCLILPWSERLPRAALDRILNLLNLGLRVIQVGGWPGEASEGTAKELLVRIASHPMAMTVDLEKLAAALKALGDSGVDTRTYEPSLRRYHYVHEGFSVWMFFNESPHRPVETSVLLPGAAKVAVYDAFDNRLLKQAAVSEAGGLQVTLNLVGGESRVFVEGDIPDASAAGYWCHSFKPVACRMGKWAISLAAAQEYPRFTPRLDLDEPANLCRPGLLPAFSGTIRYETVFACDVNGVGSAYLDLGEVGETAEVWLNDRYAGVRLSYPYLFEIADALKRGENILRVEVTNHLGFAMRDSMSRYFAMEASGLVGPVRILGNY